nr:ABC transporter transmembrane domain-containing protein [Flexivirga oryzae]
MVRDRRLPLAVTVLAFVGAGLAGLVPPWLIGRLVDAVRAGTGEHAAVVAAVGTGISAVIGGLLTWVAMSALASFSEPALAATREEVFEQALALDASRVEEAGAGDLLSRVGDDVQSVSEALVDVVPVLAQSAVAVVLTVVGLVAIDWRLALAGLVTAPFYYASLRWYLRHSSAFYAEQRIAQGERAQAVLDGVQESRTIRAFGWSAAHLSLIDTASDRARRISLDVFGMLTRFFGRNNRAEYIGLACILGAGFALVRSDLTTVGAVTAAALLFHRLFNPIGALLGLFDDLQAGVAALARLAGVALLPRPAADPAGAAPAAGDLRLAGVTFRYDATAAPAVVDVDLTIPAGRRVAVVGRTGAGKTTLGALAAGVLRPTGGCVSIGDGPLPEQRLREEVVIVS